MMSSYYQLGLIGYPLSHSYSPRLHQAALEAMVLQGKYTLHPIAPLPGGEKDLESLLSQVRTGEIQGLNVTIPHKQNVIPFLDHITPTAQAIGAVNVLYRLDGKLAGDNTDSAAFRNDLKAQLPQLHGSGQKALLLGAGGAARAVAYTLLQDGWLLTIAARRPAQAVALAAALNGPAIEIITLADVNQKRLAVTQLVINATPVGMYPEINATPLPETIKLPPQAALYDLIYNPAQTKLMRQFEAADVPAVNGAGMLVEQAALSLERWTGIPVPRSVMQRSMAAQIQKGN